MKSAIWNYALLFIGCVLFHVAGSWSLPLVDRDEPRFAEASREMIERGDYIVPHFNNQLRLDKPPLAYWAQIVSFKIFGQNDFAARADWCVKDYNHANHAPVVKLNCAVNITATRGQLVKLGAAATDPDRDSLRYHWWQYEEAGTYPGNVEMQTGGYKNASFVVPHDAKAGSTIHIILEVRDSGSPQLTRYQAVIVTVK